MKTGNTLLIALLVGITANLEAADMNRPPLVDLPLPERWLPLDEGGWTVIQPAADSRLIYVSNSEGNDETAQVYKFGDEPIGDDPVKPIGVVNPYKTIAKAMEQARDKQPDWVLLAWVKGDATLFAIARIDAGRHAEKSCVPFWSPFGS
jgi:hypothetical protein